RSSDLVSPAANLRRIVPTAQTTACEWAMYSSRRAESESSVTSARGSFPSGCRSAVFGRTCGITANPDDRRCGTSTLPTAPVAPATKTDSSGASLYTIAGVLTSQHLTDRERRLHHVV